MCCRHLMAKDLLQRVSRLDGLRRINSRLHHPASHTRKVKPVLGRNDADHARFLEGIDDMR
jgi:hypothetical protein